MKATIRRLSRSLRTAAVVVLVLILAASQEARRWAVGIAAVAVLAVVVALVRRWMRTQHSEPRDIRDGDLT